MQPNYLWCLSVLRPRRFMHYKWYVPRGFRLGLPRELYRLQLGVRQLREPVSELHNRTDQRKAIPYLDRPLGMQSARTPSLRILLRLRKRRIMLPLEIHTGCHGPSIQAWGRPTGEEHFCRRYDSVCCMCVCCTSYRNSIPHTVCMSGSGAWNETRVGDWCAVGSAGCGDIGIVVLER
ncbi:hypothetical protein CJF30_00001132 [Rutstroemia sp. NJR-2017a BBW]|nr:hypothetical protein CJF30_00001132 [Rutstroemia sp. NJR-2017a BBW]